MSSVCGVGKARWSQGDEGEEAVEIRVPIVLPPSVRPRDLTVEVKDSAVLCVRHDDTSILQWRLYEPVAAEVEWRVEDEGGLMVFDLAKKTPTLWPCLLDLPMSHSDDDSLCVWGDELDALFRAHHPPIPMDGEEAAEAKELDVENLDKLLEEAAEEVARPAPKTNDKEFIRAELENYKAEEEEIRKKLLETQTTLEAAAAEGEAAKQAQNQKEILEEMLRLHNVIREKRAKPATLTNFIEITQLDICKARINVGAMTEEEKEEYASDAERAMTAHELMTTGLMHFEQQEVQAALHFLRLAAIHHKHEQSILLLHGIYAQLQSPRGPFLLLRRALDDEDFSIAANLKLGEQFDTGARHFLPMFPAALYFYQRAAKAGSVHAMLAIAQLYLRGCTSSTMLSTEQMEQLKNIGKYHAWIEQAIDRGCGSAYFVKGCMYLKGEHGCSKSYKMAKELLEKATSSQPDIARRAPQVYVMLEKLRQEEEGGSEKRVVASPLTLAKSRQEGAYTEGEEGKENETDAIQASASLDRLRRLRDKPGAPASSMLHPKKMTGYSGNSKVFWENTVTVGLALYGLYTLAFPLRVLLLPSVYTVLERLLPLVPWMGASSPPLQF
ncbi:uncharacterized protein Tco025E_05229 [Trypanosoma conorhini]|uniref:CS domain-containing protein n=1 Tax=Trypanosoma conorhini TaxID=83891 RepID=A0A3R7MJT0_9TRYP|nr:uncharacterized protein Tco025E_05229 [Trypanosoma conorhini]RNF16303.1 hypothetical protein Tco025E_05229 [Trypanosoma conorhini]